MRCKEYLQVVKEDISAYMDSNDTTILHTSIGFASEDMFLLMIHKFHQYMEGEEDIYSMPEASGNDTFMLLRSMENILKGYGFL